MVFQLLGRAAAWDIRLNRIRINFIPLNLALLAASVGGLALGVGMIRENLANPKPRAVTIADIASGQVPEGTFVSLSGNTHPDYVIEIRKKGRYGKLQNVEDSLTAVGEGAGTVAVMARVPRSAGKFVRLVGMVRPLPAAAAQVVEREGPTAAGHRIDTRHMLAAGQRPASFSEGVVFIGISAALLALIMAIRLKRHVIFRTSEVGDQRTDLGLRQNEPIDLRVTGRFTLNSRTQRRFVEVGAQAVTQESGDVMLLSSVDASSTFMGATVRERVGTWTLGLPATGLSTIRCGELSFGGEVRPAAQILVAAPGRRPETVTLSFGSADQRTRFMRFLESRSIVASTRTAA